MKTPVCSPIRLARRLGSIAAALWLAAGSIQAQYGYDFTRLHSFSGPDGLGPEGTLIEGSDGNFYGTTSGRYGYTSDTADAATNGTVFRLTPAGTLTTLHVFAGTDGSHPQSALVQLPNGLLYGTTTGGYNGNGITVFRMATDGSGFTTLVQGSPQIGLGGATLTKGSDGNLYGTDRLGGTINDGAIFKVTPQGVFPNGPLFQAADGFFYGSTGGGGSALQGTIFRISPAGAYKSLYTLTGTDGSGPQGLVQAGDGNLYGAALQGGNPNYPPSGTVFRVTTGGRFTKLLDLGMGFGVTPSRDVAPQSNLIVGRDGALYGTGLQGGETGTGNGGVFRMTLEGVYSPVYAFDGTDGSGPYGALLLGRNGDFYGTTSGYVAQTDAESGGDQDGTIFKLTSTSTTPVLPKVVVFATTPSVALDSGKAGVFTVTLSIAPAKALVLKDTLKGTAINGVDYDRLSGTKKIQAGTTGVAIKIIPKGDLEHAAKKTVELVLETGTGYDLGKTTTAKVKIVPRP
jgi:uncharacterized repeat protein (TIGR03803 family)